MGCLFEIFFELLINGVLGLVMFIYFKLTALFVPNKIVSPKTKKRIQDIITTASVLLMLVLFIGVIFLLPGDPWFNTIGKYMTFIPLSILGIQVVLGIIVMIIKLINQKRR